MRGALRVAVVIGVVSVALAGVATADATGGDGPGRDDPGNWTWQRTYDQGGGNEVFHDAVRAGDGYLLVGTAEVGSYGSDRWDGWLVRVGPDGAVRWERRVGGPGDEVFTEIVAVGDGYVVGGMANATSRFGGHSARWLVGLGPEGERRWSHTYEPDGGFARITDLTATPDGQVIAVGDSGALRVRADDGTSVWQRTYPSPAVVTGVERTPDGYALGGTSTAQSPVLDGWLAEINGSGSQQWERHYVRDGFNRPETIARTADGGYVLAGRSDAPGTSEVPAWVVATDASGDVEWERYLRDETADGWVFDATAGRNGSVVLAGKSIPGSGWVVELDAEGDTVVSRGLGNTAKGVLAVGDGRYLVVGGTRRPYDAVARVVTFVEPKAAVRADTATAAVGDSITFDASASRGATEYRWDFDGDGEIDRRTTVPRVEVAFDRVGSRTVSVTVGDDGGPRASADVTVRITDRSPPDAELTARPERSVVGERTALDASASSDDGRIVAYRWDLDDDAAYEETTDRPWLDHAFDSPGLHRVRVQVIDTGKNTATAAEVVDVRRNRPPTLDVTVDDDIRAGVLAVFEANVTDETGSVTVDWEFPDGTKSGREVVARLPAGETRVRVVARDEYGATTVRNVSVSVPAERPTATAASTESGPGFALASAVIAVLLWIGVAVFERRREGR